MEIRCIFCGNWFIPKRKNLKTCSVTCSTKRSYFAYNRSRKGLTRKQVYYRKHKEKIKERRRLRNKAKRIYGDAWLENIDKLDDKKSLQSVHIQ